MVTIFIKPKKKKIWYNQNNSKGFWSKIKKYFLSGFNNKILFYSRKRYQKFLRRW
ncbi:MAG: hypothetical protein QXW97_02420 [Candidatus Pacearchaeota archaeon]